MNTNNKHAYLIIAHNELSLLKLLIKSLDDSRNDIFVHVDVKTHIYNQKDFNNLTCFSNLIFIKRMEVYWAGISTVKTIISMLKEANHHSQYSYYHILSGVDIPLLTQNKIHTFINSLNENNEFVNIDTSSMHELYQRKRKFNSGILQKILFLFKHDESKFGSFYFFNQKHFGFSRNGFFGKILCIIERISLAIQQLSGVKNNKYLPIYHGSAWYSITQNLVTNILVHEEWIEKHFRYCLASDELFLQTLIRHFNLSVNFYPDGNMRYIDFKRGGPYIFRNEDYDELTNSECWFARKFSTSVDKEIIKKLYYRLLPSDVVDGIMAEI